MSELVEHWIAAITDSESARSTALQTSAQELSDNDLRAVLEAWIEVAKRPSSSADQAWNRPMQAICEELTARGARPGRATLKAIAELYRALGSERPVRAALLRVLARAPDETALPLLVDLLVDDPPEDLISAGEILAPLFQRAEYDPSQLFPRLLDSLERPAMAIAVLDLANFLYRKKRVTVHPARDRVEPLVELLGGIVKQLRLLEISPETDARAARELSVQVNESVSIAISVCNALGLLEAPQALGRLRDAADLAHRPLRVAANAALARLGDADGADQLAQMAAEPYVRMAVLQLAAELHLEGKIPDEYRSAVAEAEAHLVGYLAHPVRFGIAPSSCTLRDQRRLSWPGYPEPVDCFLFEYRYRFPQGEVTNVGIAGPLECTVSADVTDWQPDDLYALFAGWDAESENFQEWPYANADVRLQAQVEAQRAHLHDYQVQELEWIARLWDDWYLIASCTQQGQAGTVIVDPQGACTWLAAGNPQRPVGAKLAYDWYKGCLLLGAFNRGHDMASDAAPDSRSPSDSESY